MIEYFFYWNSNIFEQLSIQIVLYSLDNNIKICVDVFCHVTKFMNENNIMFSIISCFSINILQKLKDRVHLNFERIRRMNRIIFTIFSLFLILTVNSEYPRYLLVQVAQNKSEDGSMSFVNMRKYELNWYIYIYISLIQYLRCTKILGYQCLIIT